MDLRSRVAFAEGHVAGSFNFEGEGKLATYLAWLIPWGKPVTLLADTAEQLADAQRELVRVGIDRPAAAATGDPGRLGPQGEPPASFPRARFADLAESASAAMRWSSWTCAGTRSAWAATSTARSTSRSTSCTAASARCRTGTVWVHCAGGMRAAIAASLLDAAGRDVVAVDDGFDAATDAGLSLASG